MAAVSPFIKRDVELEEGEQSLYNEKLIGTGYGKSQDRFMRHIAICGAAGCIRACLDHLEKKGAITQKFHSPFRRRKPWWPLAPVAD